MAALSLLFATHSYRPAPFIIFDEIDASLDNHNIKQVVHYIRRKSKSQQIIVVSHKNQFFSKAEALIGICSNVC
ncbi:structural maintenance of chromosomes protein 1-like [Orussus abietinus]|uniref:structural maintenance of chromosomes protein 1-like n=1 Tax=Orussus abietinus TaxID=222816 RepID=UPI000625EA78|nr:structural maintenance of chromosomes protein 1-like [Orussus abietinus]